MFVCVIVQAWGVVYPSTLLGAVDGVVLVEESKKESIEGVEANGRSGIVRVPKES